MRLLLDEMFSPSIAEQLRRRGHDVIASLEHDELRGLSDETLLELTAAERRVIVTHDVGDFSQLTLRFAAEERRHNGVILVPPRRFPATKFGIGKLVRALDVIFEVYPRDDDLLNDHIWLGSE